MPPASPHEPDPTPKRRRAKAGRLLWTGLGWTALAAGVLGVVLPVLPTTPFVILAAFAFGRGSPAMRERLLANRHFGPAIRDWESRGAIRTRHKAVACVLMGASFAGAVLLGLPHLVLAIQGAVLAAVGLFVATRPSA